MLHAAFGFQGDGGTRQGPCLPLKDREGLKANLETLAGSKVA